MKRFADITNDEIEEIYGYISLNVKNARKIKNMTQTEIALSMGFTTATFYTNAENCANGKHFNLEHLIKIAKILDIDLSELIKFPE